ncbi:MAG: PEP-CTERM sorting domain-containing protein [Gammaproteobacteria bacterium]|nr:PEP-CTERM sorting domain-containing protein [Gammaproteobacteria bacterium]
MNIIQQAAAAVAFMTVSFTAGAAMLTNGDFSTDGSGWSDASSTGAITFVGGAAQLDTGSGDDPYSSILVQGDDGFFSFLNPISLGAGEAFLNFDVNFSSLGNDLSESGSSFFDDYLSIALYDSLDFSYDLIFTPGVDSSLGDGWTRINLDVSVLSGREFALSFELSDQDDGFDSRVLLDNISFSETALPGGGDTTPVPVPEPNTWFLLALGVFLLIGSLKIKRS